MMTYWTDFDLNQTLAFMDDFRRRMDRAFGEFDRRGASPAETWGDAQGLVPRLALRDEGAHLSIVALLPGVEEKDLRVSLHDDVLTIGGERRVPTPEGYEAHRRERVPFQFSRSFTLPVKVDPEKVNAELKDGVLTLKLEKAGTTEPRLISVKAS